MWGLTTNSLESLVRRSAFWTLSRFRELLSEFVHLEIAFNVHGPHETSTKNASWGLRLQNPDLI